jgi:hypothetical protein
VEGVLRRGQKATRQERRTRWDDQCPNAKARGGHEPKNVVDKRAGGRGENQHIVVECETQPLEWSKDWDENGSTMGKGKNDGTHRFGQWRQRARLRQSSQQLSQQVLGAPRA